MRDFNNQKMAANKANSMPFTGLGFVMEAVQAVAQTVTVAYHRTGDERTGTAMPNFVAQPSGYSLLVTQGREIRGR